MKIGSKIMLSGIIALILSLLCIAGEVPIRIAAIIVIGGTTLLVFTISLPWNAQRDGPPSIAADEELDQLGIYRVTARYLDGTSATHMTFGSDVIDLLEATYWLHVDPNINPRTSDETPPRAWLITYAASQPSLLLDRLDAIEQSGPFWWTTPGLRKLPDQGAAILKWRKPAEMEPLVVWGPEVTYYQKNP